MARTSHDTCGAGDLPRQAPQRPQHAALFVSGARRLGILRDGEVHRVRTCDELHQVSAQLSRMAASGVPRPIAIGALPFDAAAEASLVLGNAAPLTHVSQHQVSQHQVSQHDTAVSDLHEYTVRMEPTLAGYIEMVKAALERIEHRELVKVVLGRCLSFDLSEPVDLDAVIARLTEDRRPGFMFAVDAGAGKTLLGKSPELLLRKQGERVESFPLAGSIPRVPDAAADEQRARGLLKSGKDRFEHALVVEQIADLLAPACTRLNIPDEPQLVRTPTLWHLGTPIHGSLRDAHVSSLDLARSLYPTAALCGVPTAQARSAIATLEPFERGLFGGIVGHCDAQGDGEWAVTIRCAEVSGHRVRLFAGAGIVAESDPLSELQETRAKLDTMLAVLGLKSALEVA